MSEAYNAIANAQSLATRLAVPMNKIHLWLNRSKSTVTRWRRSANPSLSLEDSQAPQSSARFPRSAIEAFLEKCETEFPDSKLVKSLEVDDFKLSPQDFIFKKLRHQFALAESGATNPENTLGGFRDVFSNICQESVIVRGDQVATQEHMGKKSYFLYTPIFESKGGTLNVSAFRRDLVWLGKIDEEGIESFLFQGDSFMRGGCYVAGDRKFLDLVFARRITHLHERSRQLSYTTLSISLNLTEEILFNSDDSCFEGISIGRDAAASHITSNRVFMVPAKLTKQTTKKLKGCGKAYALRAFNNIDATRRELVTLKKVARVTRWDDPLIHALLPRVSVDPSHIESRSSVSLGTLAATCDTSDRDTNQ